VPDTKTSPVSSASPTSPLAAAPLFCRALVRGRRSVFFGFGGAGV